MLYCKMERRSRQENEIRRKMFISTWKIIKLQSPNPTCLQRELGTESEGPLRSLAVVGERPVVPPLPTP